MRHSEFWNRMDHHLGSAYARSWASQFAIASLGGVTAAEAIESGVEPLRVWRAVHEVLELPDRDR